MQPGRNARRKRASHRRCGKQQGKRLFLFHHLADNVFIRLIQKAPEDAVLHQIDDIRAAGNKLLRIISGIFAQKHRRHLVARADDLPAGFSQQFKRASGDLAVAQLGHDPHIAALGQMGHVKIFYGFNGCA